MAPTEPAEAALNRLCKWRAVFAGWQLAALGEEAALLSTDYARRFPGITATDDGLSYDVALAAETMKGWRP